MAISGQRQRHRSGIASGQDQPGGTALLRADRAEDVGRGVALILRSDGSRAAPGPPPGDLVFLANPGFISEPEFYVRAGDTLFVRNLVQTGGESFLWASIAPSA